MKKIASHKSLLKMSSMDFPDEFSSVSQKAPGGPAATNIGTNEPIVCDFPDGQSETPGGPAAANS